MKYFSIFSGIMGFELGIERATKGEWECIGHSEIDKYAIKTGEKHFKHKNYGDARNIIPEELPDFDMLCGGFPCQSFSIAGKRKGFQDTRGTLFHEICRIVAVKRPRLLFLENVKGLLSADNGRCFATILTSLDELGYSCEWQVLNSKYFGVPQNRERVFIIGHLRGTSSRQVFPIRQTSQEPNKWASSLQHPGHSGGNYRGMNMIKIGNIAKSGHDSLWGRVYDPKGLATNLNAKGGGLGAKTGLYAIIPHNQRKEIKTSNITGTLTSHYRGYPDGDGRTGIVDNSKIRRLTPVECERLQGFPDNWTLGSDTQRYKQCGNAVTVNVIEAIMNNIIKPKLLNIS